MKAIATKVALVCCAFALMVPCTAGAQTTTTASAQAVGDSTGLVQAAGQSVAALGPIPTPSQLSAWQPQDAAQLASRQRQAATLASSAILLSIPTTATVEIPVNASPTLIALLVAQANLANARAQIHNQLLQANAASAPQGISIQSQAQQLQTSEEEQFRQQYTTQLQVQAQQALAVGEEFEQRPISLPPPLFLPPGISTKVQAFLRLQDQLIREEIQLHNQSLSLTAAARAATLLAWKQANASRFQQLRVLAQNSALNN